MLKFGSVTKLGLRSAYTVGALPRPLLHGSLSTALFPLQTRSFSTQPPTTKVNFNDPTAAYKKKTLKELLRAYLVFSMCGSAVFVNNCEKLLNLSKSVFGEKLTYAIVKRTFFAHFCAGESEEEIKPVMERLQKIGIGGILDYAAESDVPATDADGKLEKEGVISARTFDYTGEGECDKNTNIFLRSIDAVSQVQDSFAAIKITALGKASLLERLSIILIAIRKLFLEKFASKNNGKVTMPEFVAGLKEIGVTLPTEDIEKLFKKFDKEGDGTIDYIEWTQSIQLEDMTTRKLFTRSGVNLSSITRGGALPLLDENETELFDNMVKRVNRVAEAAAKRKVRLMIDAEHTYFQPAIDHFVLNLQRKYNKDFPTIFSTYQCYLTWSQQHLLNDLERAKREKWVFAGKLVRGAYMVVERARAEKMNYPSPILPTIEDTHKNYNFCASKVIDNIDRSNVIIASHNQESIEKVLALMESYVDRIENYEERTDTIFSSKNVDKSRVFFGQLLGMSDHISYPLGMVIYFNAFAIQLFTLLNDITTEWIQSV
eukprot:TRINITY_DN3124_c0_g1_i1.p1 TRINITY_DN3124_c0_g1~~TRINITY_DN3124_c0_g1_i1.p1  ORF type:complete len:544 (-),score=116.62 TRINITY_DN3124_c0_g1_i1:2-1633(-)